MARFKMLKIMYADSMGCCKMLLICSILVTKCSKMCR